MWEIIIIVAVVAAAGAFLRRSLRRSVRGDATCAGCRDCRCGEKDRASSPGVKEG